MIKQALAQDQKASLEKMIQNCPGLEQIQVSTYDGDTPQEMRPGIVHYIFLTGLPSSPLV